MYWRKSAGDVLAKVQWTFANWRKWGRLSQLSRNNINIGYMSALKLMLLEYIYHSREDILAKVINIYCGKYAGIWSIGKILMEFCHLSQTNINVGLM